MPRKASQEQRIAVRHAVIAIGLPASLEQVAAALRRAIPRRTLQRRLAKLVEEGELSAVGSRAGRRYFGAEIGTALAVAEPNQERSAPRSTDPGSLPLTSAARQIKRSIGRPIHQRHPVGYDSSFLDSYLPQQTCYLPSSLRQKLAALGQTDGSMLPAGTHLGKVLHRLLIDLSWNSSRLEGNTYSLLETQRLVEQGESAEGKRAEETQMILNHKAAIELLAEHASEIGFNRYTICNLHALLSENLLPDPAAGGRLRMQAVAIGGSVFHPLETPSAIEERFDQVLATATAIEDAFEQAFFAMVHLPYLQPFEDVNKRVSRLAANIPLIQRNLGPLSFVDVPQADYAAAMLGVYELRQVDYLRDVFEWAYERSCARYAAMRQSLGEPDAFRLRHREHSKDVVGRAVRDALDKKSAAAFIREEAEELPVETERARFVELAETELTSLHEGNFARYRLRPSEFAAWLKNWR